MPPPDYSQYTLPELLEALQNIDQESFPERVKLIQKHIEIERAKDPAPQDTEETIWKERFKAFLLDCIFALGPVILLDNLLTYPINNLWMVLLSITWFFGYFCWFEVFKQQSSPGKQHFNIQIEQLTDSVGKRLLRVFIVTSLFLVNDMLFLIEMLPIPYFYALVSALLSSAWIYNAYLALKAPDGVLLHDFVTSTRVIKQAEDDNTPQTSSALSLHKVWMLPPLAIALLVGYLYLLPEDIETGESTGQLLSEAVQEQLHTRARVTVSTKQVWSTENPDSRVVLEIEIWVPLFGWNDNNINQISELVLDNLNVEPGYYDEGELTVTTGWGFTLSNTYELEMP